MLRPLLACCTLLAAPALAQTPEEVRRHLEAELRRDGCTLDAFSVVHHGALPGAARPVVIASYAYTGCGGGQNRTATFGVFASTGRRLRELPLAEPATLPRAVARVALNGARIAVAGADFATADPLCCPSLRREVEYVVREGKLVVVPPAGEATSRTGAPARR